MFCKKHKINQRKVYLLQWKLLPLFLDLEQKLHAPEDIAFYVSVRCMFSIEKNRRCGLQLLSAAAELSIFGSLLAFDR